MTPKSRSASIVIQTAELVQEILLLVPLVSQRTCLTLTIPASQHALLTTRYPFKAYARIVNCLVRNVKDN
jgi:predicted phosphoribosyltransferase